jgi:methylated-DNA-[protein]-cysteine S-methyltransferase
MPRPGHLVHQSPIGPLLLLTDGEALTGLYMSVEGRPWPLGDGAAEQPRHPVLAGARRQLDEYFAGARTTFEVPLQPAGTEFQRAVWSRLQSIPYGATTSYGELARALGDPKASRAVGLANGRNPIPIIIPCHRVIGADGSLTGFGGGIERKRWLLGLEGMHSGLFRDLGHGDEVPPRMPRPRRPRRTGA